MKQETTAYRTKKALSESLKRMMAHKSFTKITVTELISDCGVNRKTFYYHFSDIYDLLKWTIDQEAVEVVRHFDLLLDYGEAIRFVMDYVEKNDYLINCAVDDIGRYQIRRFFIDDFAQVISSMISTAAQRSDLTVDPDFMAYVSKFYTEALAGMLIDWAADRNHRDREKTISYLTAIIASALEQMKHQNAFDFVQKRTKEPCP